MTQAYKVLGQLSPTANTLSNVYTVPASNSAVISTITICNQTASNASYSIAVAPASATDNVKHYLIRGGVVPAADSIGVTLGITVGATDQVRAIASLANVSFNVFGSEIY
jgi:hypothetical protein